MISPNDVAKFITSKIEQGVDHSEVIEIVGPKKYASNDIAKEFSKVLAKEIVTHEIPRQEWRAVMKGVGYAEDATRNFIKMTETVANGKAEPEGKGPNPIAMDSTFEEYFHRFLGK
ncbi:Rossmann-fold NAD(P)-binding domain-containing protein [Pontibacter mangrovi]|uniref:NmrA-like domain-containing protein n=1 Tax=Pontibacter mangrovi TaxID=2589816 RepID=A0A501VQU0_9BACT|nr:hypothetical protein [Pontibacter mangrovi]TPE40019.1 hypothetical protein FJM65_20645 [Pontibacter mangrovi]